MNKNKKQKVWIGTIQGIFGYGIAVVSETEQRCYNSLERSYNEWVANRKSYCLDDDYEDCCENGKKMTRFEKAFNHWGGKVEAINFDETYFDDFAS